MAPHEPGSAPATAQERTQLPPAPAPSDRSAQQYEFGYAENAVLARLGSKMGFVGLFMLGIGLFFFASELVRWVQSHELEVGILFLALLFIVVGIWTHRAGREFGDVAATQGNDVTHLMDALANLLKLYTLLFLVFFVALVFALIQLGATSLYGTREIIPGAELKPRIPASGPASSPASSPATGPAAPPAARP